MSVSLDGLNPAKKLVSVFMMPRFFSTRSAVGGGKIGADGGEGEGEEEGEGKGGGRMVRLVRSTL